MEIARILVPVDFSKAARAGIEAAAELAERFGAELFLLFVVEPLYYAGDLGLLLEEQHRFAHEEFRRLQPRLERRGLRCRVSVQDGVPYQVITDEAVRSKADLIVMATHGRTGLAHVLLGSVAERVVRAARCPVLTVRPRAARR